MDLWEVAEYIGETLVFIGVVGEVFAEWTEPERRRLAKAASIVLVIGLAISLAALIGTNEHFNDTIAGLNAQAAGLNKSAEVLKRENLKLSLRILQAGHRSTQILANEDRFSSALQRFAGQRFLVSSCPTFNDQEIYETKTVLWAQLSREAKWVNSPEIPTYVCSTGILVTVRDRSSASSVEAAKSLAKELDDILGRYKIGEIEAGQVGLSITSAPKPPAVNGEESPAPNVIMIVVGAHP